MNIGVIGGDARIVELVCILEKEGKNVFLYGLEQNVKLKTYNHVENLKKTIQNSDYVITSIPISKDGITLSTPFSNEKILLKDFFDIAKDKKIITGNITNEIKKYISLPNENIVDVLELEELTVLNAIPTAEGAIQIAMEKSTITLHDSKCLILGFGRIGKILAKMLDGLGAEVYCEARKTKDIAWIKGYGYKPIELEKLANYLEQFDFIFNTIPQVILDKQYLKLVKNDCLIIDLASKPGGIDFEEARKMGLNFEWALALPGKVAPKTAASYIGEIIKNIETKTL